MTTNSDHGEESPAARRDREWEEMLQELRVIQTGTQILAGFLLTVAFQQRFQDLDGFQTDVYLALVVLAIIATLLALAPVALHRALFRQGAKDQIVVTTNRILRVVLAVVGTTLAGTALFIFDLVAGRVAGVVVGSAVLLFAAVAWVVYPVLAHRGAGR